MCNVVDINIFTRICVPFFANAMRCRSRICQRDVFNHCSMSWHHRDNNLTQGCTQFTRMWCVKRYYGKFSCNWIVRIMKLDRVIWYLLFVSDVYPVNNCYYYLLLRLICGDHISLWCGYQFCYFCISREPISFFFHITKDMIRLFTKIC